MYETRIWIAREDRGLMDADFLLMTLALVMLFSVTGAKAVTAQLLGKTQRNIASAQQQKQQALIN